jgi:hypothetical protein
MNSYSQRIGVGRRGWLLVLVVGLLALALPAGQTRAAPEARTIRVAGNGVNANTCGGEANPCRDIQYAVDRAATGDTVLVAAGVYTRNASLNPCPFLVTQAVVCFFNKALTIRGGYSIYNWSSPSGTTVIDGQGAWSGVVAVQTVANTAFLTMSGFTIQYCRSFGSDKNGAGDSLTRQGIGAGIWGQGTPVNLTDMIFKNNIAKGIDSGFSDGGAGTGAGLAVNSAPGTSTLTRVTFEDNQALGGSGSIRGGVALGGALFTYQTQLVGNHVRFINNQAIAGNSGGAGTYQTLQADALGGAASFESDTVTTFNDVTLTGNKAVGGNAGAGGGAMGGNAFGGALFVENAVLSVNDALINGNQAIGGNAFNAGGGFAGGIHGQNGGVTINRARVLSNKAVSGASSGGSARAAAAGGLNFNLMPGYTPIRTVSIANSIIADNRIEYGGPTSYGAGGGVTIQAMAGTISHTTIARNTLGPNIIHGQGLLVQSSLGGAGTGANVQLNHSILAEHTGTAGAPALEVQGASTVTLNQNLFAGNTKNTNGDGQPSQVGTINGLGTSFYSGAGGFVSPGAPNFDYRLIGSSPALDKATTSTLTTDFQNQARPNGAARDLGADEYYALSERIYIPLLQQ